MRKRHNKILERVTRAIDKEGKDVFIEQSFSPDNLRPDIVIQTTRETVVVDVTVPYKSCGDAFGKARAEKTQKYAGLKRWMEGQPQYRAVSVHAFVVGSLGSWDPDNSDTLRALRVGQNYAKLFRKLCVADAIKGSHVIWRAR